MANFANAPTLTVKVSTISQRSPDNLSALKIWPVQFAKGNSAANVILKRTQGRLVKMQGGWKALNGIRSQMEMMEEPTDVQSAILPSKRSPAACIWHVPFASMNGAGSVVYHITLSFTMGNLEELSVRLLAISHSIRRIEVNVVWLRFTSHSSFSCLL